MRISKDIDDGTLGHGRIPGLALGILPQLEGLEGLCAINVGLGLNLKGHKQCSCTLRIAT